MASCQLEWNVAKDTRGATLAFSGTKIDWLKINNQADDVFQLTFFFFYRVQKFSFHPLMLNFLPDRCTLDICD